MSRSEVSCIGAFHNAQGLVLLGGVVSVVLGLGAWGLGLVTEAAAQAEDGDGGVGYAGEVARQLPLHTRERSLSLPD